MCKKADKIQALWPREYGTYAYTSENYGYVDVIIEKYYRESSLYKKGCEIYIGTYHRNWLLRDGFWVPTQGELQDLIDVDAEIPYGVILIDCFYNWQKRTLNPQPFQEHLQWIDSWYKLWLAFVMHIKFHEEWNGSEWVAEK